MLRPDRHSPHDPLSGLIHHRGGNGNQQELGAQFSRSGVPQGVLQISVDRDMRSLLWNHNLRVASEVSQRLRASVR